MRNKNRPQKGTGRKVYAIVVDGETEKWYLDKLRSFENPVPLFNDFLLEVARSFQAWKLQPQKPQTWSC